MSAPILSILTPAVPSRHSKVEALQWHIQYQIKTLGHVAVEHLVFSDNKRRTVGEKRDSLLRMARGKYVAFVDDDDLVSEDYVAELLKASESDPDVITFQQEASVNGAKAEIHFRLGSKNEPFCEGAIVNRNAWHVCAWRRALAIQSHFPASNYGEDWAYAAPLCALPNLREIHIPKILHYYRHSSETTEAPPPK